MHPSIIQINANVNKGLQVRDSSFERRLHAHSLEPKRHHSKLEKQSSEKAKSSIKINRDKLGYWSRDDNQIGSDWRNYEGLARFFNDTKTWTYPEAPDTCLLLAFNSTHFIAEPIKYLFYIFTLISLHFTYLFFFSTSSYKWIDIWFSTGYLTLSQ